MSNSSIPPYKPPKNIQQILDQQAALRKRTVTLPKRNWIQKNPRLFQITFITTSLLVFFSRPLYDAFFFEPIPDIRADLNFKKIE